MNYRNILKVYKLERELAPDDLALLNTLRGMSDAERELLAESLGPPAKVKAKPKTTRKIEKCVACNYTRRAIHHNLTTHKDYHEFAASSKSSSSKSNLELCASCGAAESHYIHNPDEPDNRNYHPFNYRRPDVSEKKSKRAAGLSDEARQRLSRRVLGVDGDNDQSDPCTYELDGKVCKGGANDAIHDPAMGYGGYHEFQSAESAQAATGD